MGNKKYDSSSIGVLKGLDPVKKRPGMYTDERNPNHLLQEVVDNSVDEAMAGHASEINIAIDENDAVTVTDDGRGMPIDIHPEEKISGVEVILDTLHAGGKFDNDSYGFAGGLHGVGISVVNALSDTLQVTVKREGKTYQITYHNGIKEGPLTPLPKGKVLKADTGTTVYFKPTASYFDTHHFDINRLIHLLKGKAILCPGLKITLSVVNKNIEQTFFYEQGLSAFIDEQENRDEAIQDIVFMGESKRDKNENTSPMEFSWGCYFHEEVSLQNAYVNLIPTIQGGTHVNSFRQGLFEGMSEFVALHNLNPKKVAFNAADIAKISNFVVSLKMQDASFAGQTKERLSSRECASFISSRVKDAFSLYLNSKVEAGTELFEHIVTIAAKRLRKSIKVKRKELGKISPLPGKLTDCETKDREEGELFVVEGDSAGGSAKQARDRHTQAVLPLRGKILNSWEKDAPTIMSSKEIGDIATAIGVDPGSDDLSELRYGKICVLADADSDGLHIGTLFVALMLAHFPALVEKGHIYVAMPPLYRIDVGKRVFYALDDSEKESVLKKITREKIRGEVNVQRFKGLGEMNPEQLKETTMDPSTRRLVKLINTDDTATREMFDLLLVVKNSRARAKWLSENGHAFSLTV
jgi:topoisomerase-4 subunit B